MSENEVNFLYIGISCLKEIRVPEEEKEPKLYIYNFTFEMKKFRIYYLLKYNF